MVRVASIETPSWMDPYVTFLSDRSLPIDGKEAEKMRRTSSHFWLSEDKKLYQLSFGGPYLSCLHPIRTTELLAELHEGVCGRHSGGRSLAHRAMTQGFWWPNMQREAAEYVKRCDQCQRHALILHQPSGNLNLIINPWPFAQWRLDIIGLFPRALGNKRYVVVAAYYFTKWVEAKALANIRDVDKKKFIWKNTITRYGVPQVFISTMGFSLTVKFYVNIATNLG